MNNPNINKGKEGYNPVTQIPQTEEFKKSNQILMNLIRIGRNN